MFRKWLNTKTRWFIAIAASLASLSVLGVAGSKAYRHYTLPQRIAQGQMLFKHTWQPDDPLAAGGDGLGPVFNEKSCVACHFLGGTGGAGPNNKNVLAFEALPTTFRAEVFPGVVHASATRPELLESLEQVRKLFPVVKDGVSFVDNCVSRTFDFDPVSRFAVNTPALFGAGLIDKISAFAIHGDALRRNTQGISNDLNGDFSSITVGRVRSPRIGQVGKFGWKGQFASLEDFVATACAVELGLTNPQKSQIKPGEFRHDPDAALDMTSRQLDQLVTYVASLPRPVEVLPDDPQARENAVRGKAVFAEVGCADCHTPNLGGVQGIYSDFRLYEIEPKHTIPGYGSDTLPVELPDGHPLPGEWKTPPLWGVADSAPYFHDGRSPTLDHAIRRHEGNARKSTDRYVRLRVPDRQALMAFLGTLKAPR